MATGVRTPYGLACSACKGEVGPIQLSCWVCGAALAPTEPDPED